MVDKWSVTSLDKIADWGSGGTPSRKNADFFNGDIPWVKTGDLGIKYLTNVNEFITQQAVNKSSAKLFPKNAVVLAMYGATIGKTSILNIDATTNQACAVGVPIKGITTSIFLYYFLINEKDAFIAKGKGGAQPNISQTIIKAHRINLPPLAEQKQIAKKLDELLTQVDKIKTRLDAIPKILKRFRQSVLAAAVSGDLREEEKKSNQFGKKVCIGDIAKEIKYGSSKKCNYESGHTPVLRIPNIKNGTISHDDLKFANFDEKEIKKLKLEQGDLLVIRSNGSANLIGKTAIVKKEDEHCLYAGYLIRIRVDKTIAFAEYIHRCLQSPQVRKVIEIQARSTSGVHNINSKELATLELKLPSLKEQKEIVKKVEQFFSFADKIEEKLEKAQANVNNLTQSILAKAFRGELTQQWRQQNPDLISGDNSAQVLLEKIKAEREKLIPKKKARMKAKRKTKA